MARKIRLDKLLVTRRLTPDVENARALIQSGVVLVNGIIRKSIQSQHDEHVKIELFQPKHFVSRGGRKLEGALKNFKINPIDYICLDIGSSTGGFTDCLLQNKARKVYCVDVGYGILDWKLRVDKRVVVLERTNARLLTKEHIHDMIDLCVIDASFISLNALLKPVIQFFENNILILALVKPQFQLPREQVVNGGIVTDTALHDEALDMVKIYAESIGLQTIGITPSVIRGTKGNQEYFMLLTNN